MLLLTFKHDINGICASNSKKMKDQGETKFSIKLFLFYGTFTFYDISDKLFDKNLLNIIHSGS